MSDQAQVQAFTKSGLAVRFRAPSAAHPCVPGKRHECEASEHSQRRHDSHGRSGVHPPAREHDPRDEAPGHRHARQSTRSTFNEQAGVQDREQKSECPQRGRTHVAERQKQEERKACDQDEAAAGSGFERPADAARHQRNQGREEGECAINNDGCTEPIDIQVSRRPDRLGGNCEKRPDEVEITSAIANGPPGNHEHEHKNHGKEQPRIGEGRLDARQHRWNEEQQRRSEVGRAVLPWLTQKRRGYRCADEEHDERGAGHKGRKIRAGCIGEGQPAGHHDERGYRSCDVQKHAAARDRHDEESGVHEQQEAEEQPGAIAICGHGAQVDREEQRHGGGAECRVLERRISAVGLVRELPASRNRETCDGRERKHREDAHAQGKLPGVQESEDPDPLIDRRKHDRQRGQERPDLAVCHPSQANVQEHQVRKERNGPVLSC